mmetsp:Transcript_33417/g.131808  ORF Transcript_33417/g.131808 Transcript_33417/m.131808 type:complete len:90 (+) Transcript_33417:497-766(+)
MLASSQDRPDAEYFDDEKLVGAICAGMWFNFAEETADSLGKTESELGDGDSSLRGNLRSMIVECEVSYRFQFFLSSKASNILLRSSLNL